MISKTLKEHNLYHLTKKLYQQAMRTKLWARGRNVITLKGYYRKINKQKYDSE